MPLFAGPVPFSSSCQGLCEWKHFQKLSEHRVKWRTKGRARFSKHIGVCRGLCDFKCLGKEGKSFCPMALKSILGNEVCAQTNLKRRRDCGTEQMFWKTLAVEETSRARDSGDMEKSLYLISERSSPCQAVCRLLYNRNTYKHHLNKGRHCMFIFPPASTPSTADPVSVVPAYM